jgi:hypothetical protein
MVVASSAFSVGTGRWAACSTRENFSLIGMFAVADFRARTARPDFLGVSDEVLILSQDAARLKTA